MVTNCLNYTTNYYYQLNDKPIEFRNYVCFSQLYRETRSLPSFNRGKLGIKVYFDKELNEQAYDNYCLLDDNELNQYIDWLKKTTGFKIKISNKIEISDKINNSNYKIISVSFKKKSPYEIRLISALIRNLYECPYNIMVKTAFLMKSLPEFKRLGFTSRLCIVVNSISGYNSGHSTFGIQGTDLYNNKSIKERYVGASKTENNVNSFMLQKKALGFDRIGYEYNDEFFNSLEENYISDAFTKILVENYKIMKTNNEK